MCWDDFETCVGVIETSSGAACCGCFIGVGEVTEVVGFIVVVVFCVAVAIAVDHAGTQDVAVAVDVVVF